jgi:hypothetical protein
MSVALACGFVLPSLAPDAAGLHQHQREGKSRVNATVALPAADWILQQEQPLNIF